MLVRDLSLIHQSSGHQVGVASLGASEDDFLPVVTKLREAGVSWFDPAGNPTRLARVLNIRRWCSEFKPDVIVAHSTIPGIYARISFLKQPCSIVVVLHNANCDDYADGERLEKILSRRASAIVAVNKRAMDNYQRRIVHHANLTVIRNGIDLLRFGRTEDRAGIRYRVGFGKELAVLQVGRITRIKRHDHSIRAISYLKKSGIHVRLYCIGVVDDDNWRLELMDLIEKQGLLEDVVFLGGKANVDEYLTAADVMVMPSDYESQGIAFLEGLASGCPLVGSRIPEFMEFSGQPAVRLIEPTDIPNFAQAIHEMAKNSATYRELNSWSIISTAERYERVFKSIVLGDMVSS